MFHVGTAGSADRLPRFRGYRRIPDSLRGDQYFDHRVDGVMMRVAEDGVLTDCSAPHRRFGTSYRIINLITGLQLFTLS